MRVARSRGERGRYFDFGSRHGIELSGEKD